MIESQHKSSLISAGSICLAMAFSGCHRESNKPAELSKPGPRIVEQSFGRLPGNNSLYLVKIDDSRMIFVDGVKFLATCDYIPSSTWTSGPHKFEYLGSDGTIPGNNTFYSIKIDDVRYIVVDGVESVAVRPLKAGAITKDGSGQKTAEKN